MKPQEIKDMTLSQIADTLGSLRKEQLNLRFQQASGQLKDTSQMRKTQRNIARLKTSLRQRRNLKDKQ